MAIDDPQTLVSTTWLADHLSDPDLRILDASWYLPDIQRDPKAEYATLFRAESGEMINLSF